MDPVTERAAGTIDGVAFDVTFRPDPQRRDHGRAWLLAELLLSVPGCGGRDAVGPESGLGRPEWWVCAGSHDLPILALAGGAIYRRAMSMWASGARSFGAANIDAPT